MNKGVKGMGEKAVMLFKMLSRNSLGRLKLEEKSARITMH